jgi:hypothetical protein
MPRLPVAFIAFLLSLALVTCGDSSATLTPVVITQTPIVTTQAPVVIAVTAPPRAPTGTPVPSRPPAGLVRELPGYDVPGGIHWRAVLVAPGLSSDQLTALARWLHAQAPATPIEVFDDAAQFPQFVQYQQHLGLGNEDAYPAPQAWEDAHDLGVIQKMATRPGGQWQFTPFQGGEPVDLEP